MGDPAGVGPELTTKLWWDRGGLPAFFYIGSPDSLPPDTPWIAIAGPEEASSTIAQGLPVLPVDLAAPVIAGISDSRNANAVVKAIQIGVKLASNRLCSGLATNPISKKILHNGADFTFPGHTEYLANLAEVSRPVMMLAGPSLKVVPVTTHIPLADVPTHLTTTRIIETAEIVDHALRKDFGITDPRISVAALNPHAGEGGIMGREEIEIIIPAVAQLRNRGFQVKGPLPADTMFHAAARPHYDAALTMYHDQGLIPAKALDFDEGVNVTLGLPFIRTSPGHGTAFDIAGQGIANHGSLKAAVWMAAKMATRQAWNDTGT